MHELSIAMNIADLAAAHARKTGAERVKSIELDIGTLSGVEIGALTFAMDIAFKDTILEGAEVKVNRIEARGACPDCGHESGPDDLTAGCPVCGGSNFRISGGMEMQLNSLLIE
jgi:hydrogenase nickel incorporation protein HypA/HybF